MLQPTCGPELKALVTFKAVLHNAGGAEPGDTRQAKHKSTLKRGMSGFASSFRTLASWPVPSTSGRKVVPLLNVFVRDGDRLRHSWATELMIAPRDEGEDPRHVDSIWPIWSVLDMTPEGRGTVSDFPKLHYG